MIAARGLVESRRFWTVILDTVVSTALYFVGRYVAPEIGQDIIWLVAAYQPVFVMLIAGFTTEGTARIQNGE